MVVVEDLGIFGCGNGGIKEEGRFREGFCWWRNTILVVDEKTFGGLGREKGILMCKTKWRQIVEEETA